MPEDAAPAKRGPGRPRKSPDPEVEHRPKHASPDPEPVDPRIGQECDPAWSAVGYGDGSSYRCENGIIVERIC